MTDLVTLTPYPKPLTRKDTIIRQQEKRIKELEKENSGLKERYNRVDIIGYDALKNLT